MERKLVLYLRGIYSFKNMLLLLLLMAIMGFIILPGAEKEIEYWSKGAGVLDKEFLSTPEKINNRMRLYGKQGRAVYSLALLTADMFFSVLYSIFFSVFLFFLAEQNKISGKIKFAALPFIAGICDFFENVTLSFLLSQFPEKFPFIAHLSILFTFFKWIFLWLTIICVIIGLSYWGYRNIFHPLKNKTTTREKSA